MIFMDGVIVLLFLASLALLGLFKMAISEGIIEKYKVITFISFTFLAVSFCLFYICSLYFTEATGNQLSIIKMNAKNNDVIKQYILSKDTLSQRDFYVIDDLYRTHRDKKEKLNFNEFKYQIKDN